MHKLFFFCAAILLSLPTLATATPKASIGGRFQVLQLNDMRRDQVLIDTDTGKVWHRTCLVANKTDASECQYSAWTLDAIEGITRTQKEIYKDVELIEKHLQKSDASTEK